MRIAAANRRAHPEQLFAVPEITADRHADGSIRLRSSVPLQPGARCVGDWLEHWARQTPGRVFLGERLSPDLPWTTVSYAEALRKVRAAAAWILQNNLSAGHPLVILSDNSADHALFSLAAMHVGVPVAAISPAYSLISRDFDKLKSMIGLLEPGAIYVSSLKPFAAALDAIKPLHHAAIVSGYLDGYGAISFQQVASSPETPDVDQAFASVGPDSIAK
jgi:feruloyl-CoA synthase